MAEKIFISPAIFHVLFPFGQNLPCKSFISWLPFQLLGVQEPMPWGMKFHPWLEVAERAQNSKHAAGQAGLAALMVPGQVTGQCPVGLRVVCQD